MNWVYVMNIIFMYLDIYFVVGKLIFNAMFFIW